MNQRSETQRDFGDNVKHEARLKLWLPALKNLKAELGRPLRYFTLPGPRAYDVIKWKNEGLIEFDGKGYPGVCFCEMDKDNFIKAKRILNNTRGVGAKFEDVINGEKRKEEYQQFWDLFPYDVYNLDFCGTCFEPDQPLISNTFKAIIELINTHVSFRKSCRFLLFLTIKIAKNRMHQNAKKDLMDNLESNRNNLLFRPLIDNLIGNDINYFVSNYFLDFILVSLPKLFARRIIPQTQRMSGRIENLDRTYYSRGSYYIGKFVFLIDREKNRLRSDPEWYCAIVKKSLDIKLVHEIIKSNITDAVKQDLDKLEKEIKEIEDVK